MSEPDDFAQGFPPNAPDAERNPDLDSNAIPQPVGPHSPVDQIVAYGRGAYDDVRRGADLQFHGTLKVILALHWLKLREDDGGFVRAAKKIGVARTYAYDLLKLHDYISELRTWGETYRQEHGEYPSPWAMMNHCGVGLGNPRTPRGRPNRHDKLVERMQREIERLRGALSDAEAREAELRKKLAEHNAEAANLRAQLNDWNEQSSGDQMDSRSAHSRGQPLNVRFADGEINFGGRTGQPSSTSGEKTTPPEVFARFGSHCTLDVAATAENTLCQEYFTKEQDALTRRWPPGHIIWANPPYEALSRWCAKFVDYAEVCGTVIALLPAWTDTSWFQDYCSLGEITFLRKRRKFGGAKGLSPFPSIVVRWTQQSIRKGRERRERGCHTIANTLDDGKVSPQPSERPAPPTRYWLTPPAVQKILDSKPGGYTDICPHPLPPNFDALTMKRWPGKRCYANPPYRREDELHGNGKLAWARKAIEQNRLYGTEIDILLPIFDYEYELLAAGAQMHPLGRLHFLEVDTKQPAPHPPCTALFTLPGRH